MPDQTSLEALERDVEQARARFAGDLARLRDPHTVTVAKDEFSNQAQNYKDQAVERGRSTANGWKQTLIDEVRLRVENNPTAALVIGAGIAWRLVRHPPIASLLVGVGVASLINTKPVDNGSSKTPTTDALLAARDEAMSRAHRASATVQTTTHQITDQLREGTAQAREQASVAARDASQAAAQMVDAAMDAGVQLSAAASRTTQIAREHVREKPLYFGAAALLIGAAVGLVATNRSKSLD